MAVNLDALILREDLEIEDNLSHSSPNIGAIKLQNLEERDNFFGVLRKPDFQRETAGWSPLQIVELIKNFLDGELVPAVILWKARNGQVFVIDGAHRLSALIAWVNNDYGDGKFSRRFFGDDEIPAGQKKAAELTKKLVREQIGTYEDLSGFIRDPAGVKELDLLRARNMATNELITQYVKNDAKHAEASFYKINQGGAVIDPSESQIIRARARPEAMAARALLRAGTGHKYWSKFEPPVQAEIERLAKEIFVLLYRPEIEESLRTFDFPIAGKSYTGDALAVIYEFILSANGMTSDAKPKKKKQPMRPLEKDDPRKDSDGSQTVSFLKKVKRVSEVLNSTWTGSFGLHPAVYSYSATGKFQPAAFLAQVKFVMRIRQDKKEEKFFSIRADFEDFLVKYKHFINQLNVTFGGLTRSLPSMEALLWIIFEGFEKREPEEEIIKLIVARFPKINPNPEIAYSGKGHFSTPTKVAARLRVALEHAPRCKDCRARMHPYGTTIDHDVRVQDGGNSGHSENADPMHPYCNSGGKERRIARERQPSEGCS